MDVLGVRLVRRRREADAQAAVYGSKDLREGVEALQVRFARRNSPLDTSFVYLNISSTMYVPEIHWRYGS